MTNTPQPPTSSAPSPRRRFFRRATIAAIALLVAAVATGVGVKAFAHGQGFGGWRHMDPAKMEAHVDRMLQHIYITLAVTDAQKQQLDPIVKGAARDLIGMRGKMTDEHKQALTVLTSPQVDRTALEALRLQHVQSHEEISKRVTQALADVADVLTPEQRRQLAERFGRMHGGRG